MSTKELLLKIERYTNSIKYLIIQRG